MGQDKRNRTRCFRVARGDILDINANRAENNLIYNPTPHFPSLPS